MSEQAHWLILLNITIYIVNIVHKLSTLSPVFCDKILMNITNSFKIDIFKVWSEFSKRMLIKCLAVIMKTPIW